ncbi:MAG: glucose-1-phosphate thymidylyltransferase [Thermoplasmata archaeon]
MKGLILSGGYGTRLRPLTYSQQKQLIPVANKPVIYYAIEDIIECGIKEIGIITGPNRDQVIETVNSGDWGDVTFEFIHQESPKGLAHTIIVAEEQGFLGDEPFVMYLGDNILREGILRHYEEFVEKDHDCSIMLTEVSNPQQFGIANVDDKGKLIDLVEKPVEPPTNLAVIGIYFFKPIIHQAVRDITPSWRNQLEIVDAIKWLLENDYEIGYQEVKGWWKDTGMPEDIIHANRLILDDIELDVPSDTPSDVKIEGRVKIGKDVELKNSIIKGPAVIGDNVKLTNTFIGPYTALGKSCELENTEIYESVILQGCKIKNTGRIVESLIGKNVMIKENISYPSGHKLVIGDQSDLLL